MKLEMVLKDVKARMINLGSTEGSTYIQWDVTEVIRESGRDPDKIKDLKIWLHLIRLDADTVQPRLTVEFTEL